MLGRLSDGASGQLLPFVDGAGAFTWVIHGRLAWVLLIACVHSGMGVPLCGGTWFGFIVCVRSGTGVLLCGGMWFGWYIIAIVHLFAASLAVMWHLESEW